MAEQHRNKSEEEDCIWIDADRNNLASTGKKNSTLNVTKPSAVPIPAASSAVTKRSIATAGNQMGSGMELIFPSASEYDQPASPTTADSFEQLNYCGGCDI